MTTLQAAGDEHWPQHSGGAGPLMDVDQDQPLVAVPLSLEVADELSFTCEGDGNVAIEVVWRSQSTGGGAAPVKLLHIAAPAPAHAATDDEHQEGGGGEMIDIDAVHQDGTEADGPGKQEGDGMTVEGEGPQAPAESESDSEEEEEEDEEEEEEEDEEDDRYKEDDDTLDDDSDIDIDDESDIDDGHEEEGVAIDHVAATSLAVPDGCVGADEIEAVFPRGTSKATKDLAVGVINRTITKQRVTHLLGQGANPNVKPRLRSRLPDGDDFRNTSGLWRNYSLLVLAIQNKSDYTVPIIREYYVSGRIIVLPQWPSGEQQSAVMEALIEAGADPNAASISWVVDRPMCVAVSSGDETAFNVLMARHVRLRHSFDLDHGHPVLELRDARGRPPDEYLQVLLSMYQRLVELDPTLATERDEDASGDNLVHIARGGRYPEWFIDAYLNLITEHGADIAAENNNRWTPLHKAADVGSPHVAQFLCRKLPTADINNRQNSIHQTPLARAAGDLSHLTQQLQDPNTSEADKVECRAELDNLKLTIRTLLRAGGDISSIPTDTQEGHRQRQLVVDEYATVLNKVGAIVTDAVNDALAPHRSLAAVLTHLLPLAPHHDGAKPHPTPSILSFGPHESTIFGWDIASYPFDVDTAASATTEAIGMRHTDLARRVCAAAKHFFLSAVKASSNREVVGGTRHEQRGNKRGKVPVPPLQCFVVGGVGGRKMELREVVQRAILDEAAKWEVGEIDNGFSTDVPAIEWGAVGWVDKGRDGRQTFRSLQLT
ncbi:unnamed protein product [Vitrella brassicaformis CCMP3155]|uniref:Uncharacterized protein n=1 Tax=Vitrella brassicaformis (strain CCMP3155) TaxID=1169540 RepID=A0A0G4EQV2_VITBC|nr:unnamed protein product [Vitrella brassicaformis CCMP3155]|eukprot:CEL99630.1 unnamed protein product [Vitrella brassicaformis CCMP3155]